MRSAAQVSRLALLFAIVIATTSWMRGGEAQAQASIPTEIDAAQQAEVRAWWLRFASLNTGAVGDLSFSFSDPALGGRFFSPRFTGVPLVKSLGVIQDETAPEMDRAALERYMLSAEVRTNA